MLLSLSFHHLSSSFPTSHTEVDNYRWKIATHQKMWFSISDVKWEQYWKPCDFALGETSHIWPIRLLPAITKLPWKEPHNTGETYYGKTSEKKHATHHSWTPPISPAAEQVFDLGKLLLQPTLRGGSLRDFLLTVTRWEITAELRSWGLPNREHLATSMATMLFQC